MHALATSSRCAAFHRVTRFHAAMVNVVLVSFLAGCTDLQQPTAAPGAPSSVIRGYPEPGGCVPEVITEHPNDSTETILVTFTNLKTTTCYPNLVQWGIDMADPMGVDTPQGTGSWLARPPSSTLQAANMPSPDHFATNFYTPYQSH